MSLQQDMYHAALCAQLTSLRARFDALVCYPLNQDFQLEARVTLKQLEAIEKEISDNAESSAGN